MPDVTLPTCPACSAQDWARETQEIHFRLDGVFLEEGVIAANLGESRYDGEGEYGDWYCRVCNVTPTKEIGTAVQAAYASVEPYQ